MLETSRISLPIIVQYVAGRSLRIVIFYVEAVFVFHIKDNLFWYVIPGVTLTFQEVPKKNVKLRESNLITGLDRPWGFQEVEAPRFQDSRHMKVVRLSALRTGRLYPPGNIPGTHFCYRLSQPQSHSATGRIMSMKNSNDTIGNRIHALPACSAVPQPTACPTEKSVPY